MAEAVCVVFGHHLPATHASLQASSASETHICDFLTLPRPAQNPPDVQVSTRSSFARDDAVNFGGILRSSPIQLRSCVVKRCRCHTTQQMAGVLLVPHL